MYCYNLEESGRCLKELRNKKGKAYTQEKVALQEGYPVKSILEIVQNDNETNTIVYTSKEFQPCADTFSDKYCFIGPSIRPIEGSIEKKAEKLIYITRFL